MAQKPAKNTSETAFFAPVFAQKWAQLPPVFHKHYAPRRHSHDVVVMEGRMDSEAAPLARILSPLLRLAGMPPLFSASGMAVTLQLVGQKQVDAVVLQRIIRREGKRKPLTFHTVIRMQEEGMLREETHRRTGWKMQLSYADGQVKLLHQGYFLRIFGRDWPLKLEWLAGYCEVVEKPLDDNRFSVQLTLRRRSGAVFYHCHGEFTISGVVRRG